MPSRNRFFNFWSQSWLNHQNIVSKAPFHQVYLWLFDFLLGNTNLWSNSFLPFQNKNFCIGQVLNHKLEIFRCVVEKRSLFNSCLISQAFVFRFNNFERIIHNLRIGCDMYKVDCSREILNLNGVFGIFKSLIFKIVLKSRNQLFRKRRLFV